MDYQPVTVRRHARPHATKHSAESRYWRQFKHPVFVKEYAPVTSIHFSPAKPHRYAVTAATRVQIYAPRTQKVTKTISRFKDVARSGNIRSDGKLVVAGDDTGLVQIFDINSRAILRTLDSHKQPVHVTKFSPLSHTQVLSCSDDTTVKLWDMPSQVEAVTLTSHADYVRSGEVSPCNPHLILTGSYDGTMRLHDSRSGECEMIMIALSTAGPILRVWDLNAGGRCIRALSNHQKTVTSLAYDANAGRLLTGSLDQMVKVYDISTYKVVHTMRYPASVLCLAISPDETHIAAGMSDGTLSVRRRQSKVSETSMEYTTALKTGTYETFLGGTLPLVGQGRVKTKTKAKAVGDAGELRVESRRVKRLKQYDRFLKAFKYSAALDAVLQKNVPPTTTFSLIQELIHRDGLRSAMSGRDDVLLEPILRLLVKHVTDPRFGDLVCDVASLLIELYSPVFGQSPLVDSLLLRLRKKVLAENPAAEGINKNEGRTYT
ncbi:Trp-Asp repeat-containing protein [Pisolithus croceorrhizus]|nr:Trp-Asp repeat-containing protein [Pisolithus croceorrhizus]